MNEGDELFPSIETRKRKRRYGFRYSRKKELERLRAKKRTAKFRRSKLTTVTKVLLYVSALSYELGIIDQHDYAIGSRGLPLLETVHELEEKE
jgi:hypothetical protein